jgi:hypothetical protein
MPWNCETQRPCQHHSSSNNAPTASSDMTRLFELTATTMPTNLTKCIKVYETQHPSLSEMSGESLPATTSPASQGLEILFFLLRRFRLSGFRIALVGDRSTLGMSLG